MAKKHLSSGLPVGAKDTAGWYVRIRDRGDGYQYVGPFVTEPAAIAFRSLAFPDVPMARDRVEYWTADNIRASRIEGDGHRFDLPTDKFVAWDSWAVYTTPDASTVRGLLDDAERLAG